MDGITKTVKLKNATFIGDFDTLLIEVMPELEDCYIIARDSIKNIESRLQGAKVITTKPIF